MQKPVSGLSRITALIRILCDEVEPSDWYKIGENNINKVLPDPDIVIDNDPIREQMGEDQQLEKAIEVVLEQLKDRKPLPKVPAPRTFKDLGLEQK